MKTHHLNIVEHRPLYDGDVLGDNRGEIWSDLEAGKVYCVWFEVGKERKRKKKIMWRERERERERENQKGKTEN
jgi:hypothetical protein